MPPEVLRPAWGAGDGIRALATLRGGGVSQGPFGSLNLSRSAGDDPAAVDENRRRFADLLGARPVWLDQVHGTRVAVLQGPDETPAAADASVTLEPGVGCVVMVADCLPVLLCTRDGRAVGAAHAGWRGLAAGVLDNTVSTLCAVAGAAPDDLMAWLGPCIGAASFEVGLDVLQAFGARPGGDRQAVDRCFVRRDRPDGSPRWLADLTALARLRLLEAGVGQVHGGDAGCTVQQASRFFSFRRDGRTGRMAAAIAIAG